MTINQLRRRARRRAYRRNQPRITIGTTFGIMPTVWNVAPWRVYDYVGATEGQVRAAIAAFMEEAEA